MSAPRCLALPPEILRRHDLSPVAKLVASALNGLFARFDPSTWVGNTRLARSIGRSVGHARRGLAELVARGLVARERTREVPTGRRLWLLWRDDEPDRRAGARPPCAPARTDKDRAVTQGKLRNVTRPLASEAEPEPGPPVAPPAVSAPVPAPDTPPDPVPVPTPPPALAPMPSAPASVPPIPQAIQALRGGAPADRRADLVNRIAHRLRDREPATYGFVRRWVNAAAQGEPGAVEALAHGYAWAESALMSNHPRPGSVLVRRVKDFVYRPPAASTVGAVAPHQVARPGPVASPPVEEAAGPASEGELEAELSRVRVLSRRFGGGFRRAEADLEGRLTALRAGTVPMNAGPPTPG